MNNEPIVVTTAVILAGGLSRRMFNNGSGDKSLLALDAGTMLDRVIARIAPQVENVIINANGDAARFQKFGLHVVPDPIGGYAGPLAGVLAGMQWVEANEAAASHIVTVSSDVPFLPGDLVARLRAAAVRAPRRIVLAASSSGVHPVIGFWPLAHAGDLAQCLAAGDRKVLSWAERHGIEIVQFGQVPVGGTLTDPFFNANTPAELDQARRIIRGENDAE